MVSNNNKTHRNSIFGKRADLNGMNSDKTSEIGFPNNKDRGKGKKSGIVGKG